ncbi:hypothetical protein [Leifsonia xyli]|uniref:hypothetical protein n=1 Tax=Leifsonia xyli TaxID=1575 RepID=UPI00178C7E5A|nr:hypothetical protein [Leifsonia xyli]
MLISRWWTRWRKIWSRSTASSSEPSWTSASLTILPKRWSPNGWASASQPTVAAFERYEANPTLSTIRHYALAIGAGIKHHVEDQCYDIDTEFNVIAQTRRGHECVE